MGVLDKAVSVLDALVDGPRSLAELVERTGISRATTHRVATALEAHGLLRRDDEGRFALGARLVAMGHAALDTFPLAEVAGPVLDELRRATGESVQVYVRDGDRRVCIAALESPHGLRTIVPVGASLTLEMGSAGRLLAGDADVLRRGWAESVGEREAGVASVSAPVHDSLGRVTAAISVSGPIERTSRQPGQRYASAVTDAARRLEALAGWSRDGTDPG